MSSRGRLCKPDRVSKVTQEKRARLETFYFYPLQSPNTNSLGDDLFLSFAFCYKSLRTTTNAKSICQSLWRCCQLPRLGLLRVLYSIQSRGKKRGLTSPPKQLAVQNFRSILTRHVRFFFFEKYEGVLTRKWNYSLQIIVSLAYINHTPNLSTCVLIRFFHVLPSSVWHR